MTHQPEPGDSVPYLEARRTTLNRGAELDYERIHATVPEAVAHALRDSGVREWRIWRDGRFLFHTIETEDGYDAMIERITALGPIDREWDLTISSLLESSPASDTMLNRVWSLNG